MWYHLSYARVLNLENKRACAMLAAMTHPSTVLNFDIKAEAFFMPKSYILLQTVLFRPSGPHQCSADARMEVKLCSHLKRSHICGISEHAQYIHFKVYVRGHVTYPPRYRVHQVLSS